MFNFNLGNDVDSVREISKSSDIFLERCGRGPPAVNLPIEDRDDQQRGRNSSNLKNQS